MATENDKPQQASPAAVQGQRKDVHHDNPSAPKYTREQSAAAEQKVVENASKATQARTSLIERTVADLVKNLEKETPASRNEVMSEITHRVQSIKVVAAASHLRPSRFAVMQEEDKTMPRLTPSVAIGETPRRNIMQQGEQNETELLKEKK